VPTYVHRVLSRNFFEEGSSGEGIAQDVELGREAGNTFLKKKKTDFM